MCVGGGGGVVKIMARRSTLNWPTAIVNYRAFIVYLVILYAIVVMFPGCAGGEETSSPPTRPGNEVSAIPNVQALGGKACVPGHRMDLLGNCHSNVT